MSQEFKIIKENLSSSKSREVLRQRKNERYEIYKINARNDEDLRIRGMLDNPLVMKSQDAISISNTRNFTPSKKTISQLKSQPNLLNSPCHYAAKQQNSILKVLKKDKIKFMNDLVKKQAKPKERKLSINVKRRGKSVNRPIEHRKGKRFKHVLRDHIRQHKIRAIRRIQNDLNDDGVYTDDSFEQVEEIFSEPDTQANLIVNKYESK